LQSGVLSLECQWFVAERPPLHFSLRLVQPIQDSDYLQSLLQLQWERVQLPAEVKAVHVLIPLIAADKPQQQWLFADSADTRLRHRATLLDRLAARLGADHVLQQRWVPQALPERGFAPRVQVRRQTAAKPRGRQATTQPPGLLERPTRLYHPPYPLANPADQKFHLPGTTSWVPAVLSLPGNRQQVQHAVGPERIESQWWEGRWERRDYFRVQTETGERFWIFQEIGTGRWWLQGDFA
jgi:protein ImuB